MTTEQTTRPKKAKQRSLPVSETYRRTIAVELFKQWRQLARKNDPQAIAEHLGMSKPTIHKALIYGNVNSEAVKNGITTFFADRLRREMDEAEELEKLRLQSMKYQQGTKVEDVP